MKTMASYENAQSATTDLPFGAFSDESSAGSDDGTQIVAAHLQDVYYALYQILQLAGVSPNGSLENGSTQKQFLSALSNVATLLHNSTTTYAKGAVCFDISGDNITFYKSKVNSNTAALSNTTNWAKICVINNSGVFSNITMNSPALTGTPTAPTAADGTNNTQIATTAFVKNQLSGKVFIIEAAWTANTWYKKYSNGWCEQGGYITTQTNFSTPITFPVEFLNTDYFLNCIGEGKNNGSAGNCGYFTVLKNTKSTTGFNMQTCKGHFSAYYWEAKGRYV